MTDAVNDTVKLAEKLRNTTSRRHNDCLVQEMKNNQLRKINKQAREEIAAKQMEESCNRWNKYLEKAKQRDNRERDNRMSLIDRLSK